VTASKNVRVSHCSTLGGRHGIGVNGHVGNPRKNGEPYGCWHTVIDGCHIAETWDTFIPVGLCASYVTIRGCVCEGSAAHGFDIFNSDHVLVTGNTLSNWMDPGVLSPYAEQAVGIFVHCDWGNSLEIPTRNVVISGNLLIRDEYPPKVRPVGISVIGTVDGASIAGNVVCGGQTGLAVTDIKGQGKRFAPRNVVITGNVFKGQKLSLWIDSAIAMPVLVSSNIFDPECDGQIAHFGEKTQGVKFTNNAVMRGKLPRVPSGITWDPDDRRK
jgi:polygalacturonase